MALRQELARRGVDFVAEHAVGQYSVDIALVGPRIAIEADGDYWHGNARQQAKDRQKTGYLTAQGWRVFRFTETEIKADASACIDRALRPPVAQRL
jgi:very-short-patch-repair endonuclease